MKSYMGFTVFSSCQVFESMLFGFDALIDP